MGSKEMDKSSKEGKDGKDAKTPSPQDQSSAATGTVNADWSGFQAYSSMPHGYMASSPQAHPYMWGVQPMMPPYGTPPYVAMYPHGGIYAHPSMPAGSYPFSPFPMPSSNGVVEALGNTHGSVEADGKISEGKEKLPIKRSKGSLGSLNMITGKNGEPGKASGTSANGAHSKSAEGDSEGSSEGSDGDSENVCVDSQLNSGAEASQNDGATHSFQNGTGKAPHPMVNQTMTIIPMPAGGATGPTTNLNIGMDYWSATNPNSTVPTLSGKMPVGVGISSVGSRDVQSHWIQDERELKKQRRKQSNRESARRSRLRKQAECDELAQRAEGIKEENTTLRSEVTRLRSEYERLLAQNASLKERLGETGGQEDEPTQTNQTE